MRIAKLIVVLAATLLALAIGEAVLRLCYRPPEYSWYPRYALVPDAYTGSRFAPHLKLRLTYSNAQGHLFRFSTNSMGFRSRELPWRKPAGAFRVLFIGDSFTEGFGVNDDETFPHYFEQIARRIDPRVEVINAGQNACDFPEYLGLARGYVARLAPDLVVLSIYAGNDVPIEGPPGPPPRFAVSYGIRTSRQYADRLRDFSNQQWILMRRPNSALAGLDRALHRHSLLYQLSTAALARLRPARWALAGAGVIEVKPPLAPVALGRAVAHSFLKTPPPDVEAKLRESLADLREIKVICDKQGARLFVQIIPVPPSLVRQEPLWEHIRTQPEWVEVLTKRLGRPPQPDDLDRNIMNERVRQMVEEAGLEYVDLTTLDARGKRFDEFHQLTYGASLGHFTPDENLFDALVLLKELIDRKHLPPNLTDAALERTWRNGFARVQPPFFVTEAPGPPRPEWKAVDVPLAEGHIDEQYWTFPADRFVKEGWFKTPILNVSGKSRETTRVPKGRYVEYELPWPRPLKGAAVELCRPAVDDRLSSAVRQSLTWHGREWWSSLLEAGPQGRWVWVVLPLDPAGSSGTLTVRVEATRDFEYSAGREFPLTLRLRRLRVFE
jgi:hypothetical protein